VVRYRGRVAAVYLAVCVAVVFLAGRGIGTQIFPNVDTGQFSVRLRAPTGTRIENTEELAHRMLQIIADEAGPGSVEATVGYVGTTPAGFSNQAIYLWSSGPEEAQFRIALKHDSGDRVEELQERLRRVVPERLAKWYATRLLRDGLSEQEAAERVRSMRLSFGPADVVNEVMSFGAAAPVEVAVHGPNPADNLAHAEKVLS
jgi:multidrug efflux pump subunit AcrB